MYNSDVLGPIPITFVGNVPSGLQGNLLTPTPTNHPFLHLTDKFTPITSPCCMAILFDMLQFFASVTIIHTISQCIVPLVFSRLASLCPEVLFLAAFFSKLTATRTAINLLPPLTFVLLSDMFTANFSFARCTSAPSTVYRLNY